MTSTWLDPKSIEEIIQNPSLVVPDIFDWEYYIEKNDDLLKAGINNKDSAIAHYVIYGQYEKRLISKTQETHNSNPYKDIIEIDTDFDADFYLSEYPDVAAYYKDDTRMSQIEKLFHHYINFGKNEGRFKNINQRIDSIKNINTQTSINITTNDLICPKNILQCVCLLTTNKEVDSGQLNRFISHLTKVTKPSRYSKKIDFKIIINQSYNNEIKINKLQQIFANIEIINLKLKKTEDIYLKKPPTDEKLPEYGLKSGPNITFFNTLNICKKYNTTLLLETDCLLNNKWLDRIYLYTKYANGFLISGGTYDGLVFTKSNSAMMSHINGGTGLYATNHFVLHSLIDILKIFMQNQISNNMPGLAYDYALKIMIDANLDSSFHAPELREIWKFINRNYLPCKLIINCSTATDNIISKTQLNKVYNYAILHQKQ